MGVVACSPALVVERHVHQAPEGTKAERRVALVLVWKAGCAYRIACRIIGCGGWCVQECGEDIHEIAIGIEINIGQRDRDCICHFVGLRVEGDRTRVGRSGLLVGDLRLYSVGTKVKVIDPRRIRAGEILDGDECAVVVSYRGDSVVGLLIQDGQLVHHVVFQSALEGARVVAALLQL